MLNSPLGVSEFMQLFARSAIFLKNQKIHLSENAKKRTFGWNWECIIFRILKTHFRFSRFYRWASCDASRRSPKRTPILSFVGFLDRATSILRSPVGRECRKLIKKTHPAGAQITRGMPDLRKTELFYFWKFSLNQNPPNNPYPASLGVW